MNSNEVTSVISEVEAIQGYRLDEGARGAWTRALSDVAHVDAMAALQALEQRHQGFTGRVRLTLALWRDQVRDTAPMRDITDIAWRYCQYCSGSGIVYAVKTGNNYRSGTICRVGAIPQKARVKYVVNVPCVCDAGDRLAEAGPSRRKREAVIRHAAYRFKLDAIRAMKGITEDVHGGPLNSLTWDISATGIVPAEQTTPRDRETERQNDKETWA